MGIFFKGSINSWHDDEDRDGHEEECSKHGPVELVEKQEVGPASQSQASLRKADQDHPEEEAEEEGEEVAGYHDGLANLDDHAAVESLFVIIERVGDENGSSIDWGQQA